MTSKAASDAINRNIRDAGLIQRVREGDAQALDELIRLYGDILAQSAYTLVGTRDVAQDIVQNVFIRIWNTRATLEIHGSVLSYLIRAARNQAVSVIRHEHAQGNLEEKMSKHHEIHSATSDTSIDPETAEEFISALENALLHLSPRVREIFLMRADWGLSYEEIAETLGIGRATVHNKMSLAVKALAAQLSGWRKFLG